MRDSFQRWVFIATAFIVLVMIVLSVITPKGNEVLWINGHHNEFSDRFFSLITYGGDGLIFIPLLLISIFIRFRYLLIAVTAWAGHGLVCSVFKRTLFPQMLRPAGILDNELLHFVPGVVVHHNNAFPSGHTATAFCLAVVVSLLCRSRAVTVLMLILAALVGYSRIYLLQHFLMDVAAGAFIGSGIGALTWYLFQIYGKAQWLNLRIHMQVKGGGRSVTAP